MLESPLRQVSMPQNEVEYRNLGCQMFKMNIASFFNSDMHRKQVWMLLKDRPNSIATVEFPTATLRRNDRFRRQILGKTVRSI